MDKKVHMGRTISQSAGVLGCTVIVINSSSSIAIALVVSMMFFTNFQVCIVWTKSLVLQYSPSKERNMIPKQRKTQQHCKLCVPRRITFSLPHISLPSFALVTHSFRTAATVFLGGLLLTSWGCSTTTGVTKA